MIVYGAGGHAKVICDVINADGGSITAVFDDDVGINQFLDYPVYPYSPNLFPEEPIVLAIGDNATRGNIARRICHRFVNVIHPSALITNNINIGAGNFVMHRVVIQAGSRIGNHCIINTGAIVEHDAVIGDFVHIAPGAIVCGSVTVGDFTLVGAGATLVPNIVIGKNCVIGAGSVIIRDIPDNVTVCGNPGRVIKH
ncbi:acetyltransferase [Dyadobacter luticola]|uniref:Acetyltransferase n=1 Tax=Dyadobacter luticola TaxID=1979387 RepID=A0A5R9KPA5_9BACT|nr:acetyltransferase [Dyadobacter luticola]TLU98052.1 acetyltransferase [Dyadobacter luticola]